jgi:hypothetical protein
MCSLKTVFAMTMIYYIFIADKLFHFRNCQLKLFLLVMTLK